MSSKENSSKVTDMDMAAYDPLLDREWAWLFTAVSLTILLVSLAVQRSIFKLLKRHPGRAVNKIILFQQFGVLSDVPFQFFATLNMFVYPVKDIVGEVGCYVIDFLEHYTVIVLQTTSFYISLFRYFCIAHQSLMLKYGISPMGVAKRVLICQYSIPALFHLIVRLAGTLDPGNGRGLLLCLGRYHEMFDGDLAHNSCKGTTPWYPDWILCQSLKIIVAITSSNIIEIFLLWRCIQLIKDQTRDIKSLLSKTAFQKRQRENDIMFAVNIWQYCLELVLTVSFLLFLLSSSKSNVIVNKMWFIYITMFYAILNGFYLLGDEIFIRHAREEGFFKALWRALLQNY